MVYQLFKLGNKIATLEPTGTGLKLVPGAYRLTRLHFKYLIVNYTHILISGGMKSTDAFFNALRLIEDKPLDSSLKKVERNGLFKDILIAKELDTLGPEIEHAFNSIEYEYFGELGRFREKIMLALQLTVAVIVGALVIAMYLPIFQLGQVV
jgi:hypothetical protein